jgi:hypothetical protein
LTEERTMSLSPEIKIARERLSVLHVLHQNHQINR